MSATESSSMSDTPAADPTLTALAPTSTRPRNRLLVLTICTVLVAAMFSPTLLRPSVVPANGGSFGSWHALPSHRQVVTITQVTGQNWPSVELRSVLDVPGAEVENAWMVDDSVLVDFDDSVDESAFDSGDAYLRGAMPEFDPAADALPRRIGRDQSGILIVLWNVTGCDALDTVEPAPAMIALRTVVRTGHREELPAIAAPGFDVATLREVGACA